MASKKSLLAESVTRLHTELCLEKAFDWKIPVDCPITIPDSLKSPYERNVYLKENYAPLLSDLNNFKACFWIIQRWGGIRSFKDTHGNREKIALLRDQLSSRKMTQNVFSVISSLSKLAAFQNPDLYAIYDSRAIAALNWLLFCSEDTPRLFPQPPGRNSVLLECDPNTLMRLSGKEFTVRSHKSAFFEYCELLRSLCETALNGAKLYQLEMMLFVAAPSWIVTDIRARTKVSISC
jgi:hypothetical protein